MATRTAPMPQHSTARCAAVIEAEPEQRLAAALIKDTLNTLDGRNWPFAWDERKRDRYVDEARRWLECPRFAEVWLAAVTPAGMDRDEVRRMVLEAVEA